MAVSIPAFVAAQVQLLRQEHEAEISSSALASIAASTSPSTRRTLQATGYALTGIILNQCRTGLGGRTVGEFTADPAIVNTATDTGSARLSTHGIRVGDNVRVNDTSGGGGKKGGVRDKGKKPPQQQQDSSANGPEGVVTRVGERSIFVAFGQAGSSHSTGGGSGGDEEEIDELWGKKLWLYGSLVPLA